MMQPPPPRNQPTTTSTRHRPDTVRPPPLNHQHSNHLSQQLADYYYNIFFNQKYKWTVRKKKSYQEPNVSPGNQASFQVSQPSGNVHLNAMQLLQCTHTWQGVAKGNRFRVGLRRQMKCAVPTPRETLHPQHLQTQEFWRQWGQTHGLKSTMDNYLVDLQTAACTAAEPAKLAVCHK